MIIIILLLFALVVGVAVGSVVERFAGRRREGIVGGRIGVFVGVGFGLAELRPISSWITSHGIHGGNLVAMFWVLFLSGLAGAILGAVISSRRSCKKYEWRTVVPLGDG
jgi:hypothetical protein